MKKDEPKSLNQCLIAAISSCKPELNEEEGGFIIKKEDSDEYEFHKVTNRNTGTPVAVGLFTATEDEYGDKVLKKTNTGQWFEYASFHTHPRGCEPYPSSVDLNQLFMGFPINYIYSPHIKKLICYTFNKEKEVWQAKQIQLKNLK